MVQRARRPVSRVNPNNINPEPCTCSGQGVARQRKAIVDGLRDSVVGFQSGVSDVSSRDVRTSSFKHP